MAGNTIGQVFTVTTCGESHGAGLMAIVDGVPPGLPLTEADLQIFCINLISIFPIVTRLP